ncbi:MAG: hypothetical protein JNL11_10205 [Bdellovibrionaceae bacterium]|nr:hypothetical protein [Pseudobdellovibrionaceae bacterium]
MRFILFALSFSFLATSAMAGPSCQDFYGDDTTSLPLKNSTMARLAKILEAQEVDATLAIEQVSQTRPLDESQMRQREALTTEFKKALADRPDVSVSVLKSVINDLRSIKFFMGPYHERMVELAIEYSRWSGERSVESNIQKALLVSRSTNEADIKERKLFVDNVLYFTRNDLTSIDDFLVRGISKTPEALMQRHFKYIHPRMNRSPKKLQYFVETLKDITKSPEKTEAFKMILEHSLYDMTRVVYHRHLGKGSKFVGNAIALATTIGPFAASVSTEILFNHSMFGELSNTLPTLAMLQGFLTGLVYVNSVSEERQFGKSLGAKPITKFGGKFTLPGKESLVFWRRWKQKYKIEKDLVAQILSEPPKEIPLSELINNAKKDLQEDLSNPANISFWSNPVKDALAKLIHTQSQIMESNKDALQPLDVERANPASVKARNEKLTQLNLAYTDLANDILVVAHLLDLYSQKAKTIQDQGIIPALYRPAFEDKVRQLGTTEEYLQRLATIIQLETTTIAYEINTNHEIAEIIERTK